MRQRPRRESTANWARYGSQPLGEVRARGDRESDRSMSPAAGAGRDRHPGLAVTQSPRSGCRSAGHRRQCLGPDATGRGERPRPRATGVLRMFGVIFISEHPAGLVHGLWRYAGDLGGILQVGAQLLPPRLRSVPVPTPR
jgi:hypothetical protein